jgi:hypothetical protein
MDPFTELRKHAGSNHPQKAKVRHLTSAPHFLAMARLVVVF